MQLDNLQQAIRHDGQYFRMVTKCLMDFLRPLLHCNLYTTSIRERNTKPRSVITRYWANRGSESEIGKQRVPEVGRMWSCSTVKKSNIWWWKTVLYNIWSIQRRWDLMTCLTVAHGLDLCFPSWHPADCLGVPDSQVGKHWFRQSSKKFIDHFCPMGGSTVMPKNTHWPRNAEL